MYLNEYYDANNWCLLGNYDGLILFFYILRIMLFMVMSIHAWVCGVC